jgi:hypothetical protein
VGNVLADPSSGPNDISETLTMRKIEKMNRELDEAEKAQQNPQQ